MITNPLVRGYVYRYPTEHVGVVVDFEQREVAHEHRHVRRQELGVVQQTASVGGLYI